MKRILLMCIAAMMLLVSGCYKDDINDLKNEVDKLKEQMAQYETLLHAVNSQLYITSYEMQDSKYVITLSDGSELFVLNSSAFVSIGENGNWFIDGEDSGQPAKGQSPTITIGKNGNWLVDGNDTGVPASGVPGESGKDAPAITSVSLIDHVMTFTFSDGKTLQLQIAAPQASIDVPSGGFVFNNMQWIRIEPSVKDFDGATFRWALGEKEISTEKNLLHVFDIPGNYQLTFTVKNDVGETRLPVTLTINQAAYINAVQRVYEYLPAPGQYTNKMPLYIEGETMTDMAQKAEDALKNNGMICLGAYGGYVVMGFDHTIVNVANERDFIVKGNGYAGSAEPGIIMVSYDTNGNSLPDDEWYEIAGAAHHLPATIRNYEITYYKPDPANGNVRWTDNRDGEGTVDRNSFHAQASYYPLWHNDDKLTFKGTLLPTNLRNAGTPEVERWTLDAYEWGYADNQPNTSENAKIDIDWAVDVNGNPVKLKGVDFIKVYTGVNQKAGWLGETSTEVSGVEDLHLQSDN